MRSPCASGRTPRATRSTPAAAGLAALAMLDRFHYLREFVGKPVDDTALDTLTTMLYRALFDPNA